MKRSDDMKQLEVQILGQSYLLGCPEGGESQMLLAVQRVDSAMRAIRDAGRIRARDRIAVLAALNIAYEQVSVPPAAPPASAPPASLAAAGAVALDDPSQQALLGSILEQLDAALGNDERLL